MSTPNQNNPVTQELREFVSYLLRAARNSEPQAFKAFLMGGILANVIANLPEEYFERMIKVEPCGRAGCDCHLLSSSAVNFLRDLREDYSRHAGMMHKD